MENLQQRLSTLEEKVQMLEQKELKFEKKLNEILTEGRGKASSTASTGDSADSQSTGSSRPESTNPPVPSRHMLTECLACDAHTMHFINHTNVRTMLNAGKGGSTSDDYVIERFITRLQSDRKLIQPAYHLLHWCRLPNMETCPVVGANCRRFCDFPAAGDGSRIRLSV